MQIASPTMFRGDGPARRRVRKLHRLIAVPAGAMMIAMLTAMPKQMAGQTASRAELLEPMFEGSR